MKPEVEFVKRLGALFGVPDSLDAKATIAEYQIAMFGHPADVLNLAADILARTHRIRTWPTIAECLDAVDRARKSAPNGGAKLTEIEDYDHWWMAIQDRIGTAETEADIATELSRMEPYVIAKWVPRSHWDMALALATARRRHWAASSAKIITARMLGETRTGDME